MNKLSLLISSVVLSFGFVVPVFAHFQIGADIDGAQGVQSGSSVAMSVDGTRVAIGAPNDYYIGRNNSGHVRVYQWNGTNWTQVGADINGEASSDYSGSSVAMSADGTRVAIGAPNNDGNGSDSGHVRIYQLNGINWTQVGADINGEADSDYSGSSVSMSADGTRVAIGAPYNDGNGFNSGHVRVYQWIGSSWMQVGTDINGEQEHDSSSRAVAMSADGMRLAIGAIGNDGNGDASGHARVYQWNGTNWTQVGADINGEASSDFSGSSVAMSSDGTRVAIGAPNNDGNGSDSGHVRVYQLTGSIWMQVGADINGEASSDNSGSAIAMSSDGNRVVICAPYNDGNRSDSGHASIFGLFKSISGGVIYVDVNCTNSIYPYSSWETASTSFDPIGRTVREEGSITESLDVWVADGTYSLPSSVLPSTMLSLQSLYGSSNTTLIGAIELRGSSNQISGITVSDIRSYNAPAQITDVVVTGVISNCYVNDSTLRYLRGGNANHCLFTGDDWTGVGVESGSISNCTVSGYRIGIRSSTAVNCVISNNYNSVTNEGCGAVNSTVSGCLIAENIAEGPGGGVYNSTVSNCIIQNNMSFQSGGGVFGSTVINSELIGNHAFFDGGGIVGSSAPFYKAKIVNSVIRNNYAGRYGGGSFTPANAGLELINCTLADNLAADGGHATHGGKLSNVIVYQSNLDNVSDLFGGTPEIRYSCVPGIMNSFGNISLTPLFVNSTAGNYRPVSNSPCINAGFNGFSTSPADRDGNPRLVGSRIDMGAYEYQSVALVDSDGDGASDAQEAQYGTNPNLPDSDGDGFDDGFEVAYNMNPSLAETWLVAYVTNHPESFDLPSGTGVIDVAVGEMLLATSNGMMNLSLQLQKSPDLTVWTNAGAPVKWTHPAGQSNEFYRVRAEP